MKPTRRSSLAFVFTFAAGLAACSVAPADESASTSDSLDEAPHWKVLAVDYQVQQTGYWCGPASTRIALSARSSPPSQADLARELGTTTNGTDFIGQVTNVLDAHLGAGTYVTKEMPNDPPTQGQRDMLWTDIVRSVDAGYAVVTNIVAPPSNHPPGYPNATIYHYFAVIGYNPDTRQVYVADPASFAGHQQYWLSFDQLATLIPPKGYSAAARTGTSCPGATGAAVGAIEARYLALGGCASILGAPITDERGTPDGVGRYTVFERGSIYWTPSLGAHEVLGRIRDEWKARGWEAGPLGYPISGEYDVPGGRRSDFEHGSITWRAATDDFVVTAAP